MQSSSTSNQPIVVYAGSDNTKPPVAADTGSNANPAGSGSPDQQGSAVEVPDTGSADTAGSDKGSAVIKPRIKPAFTYTTVINSKQPAVQRCLRDHNDGTVPKELHAVIAIAPSGKPK